MSLEETLMSITTLLKDQEVYQYLLDHSLKSDALLSEMFEKAKHDDLCEMITAPEQIQFLALLIRMLNAKKTVEVGVFRGVGSLGLSLALPDDGVLYACDITDEYLHQYKTYWDKANVAHKIQLKIAPAVDTLNLLLEEGHRESFDFAYIDADKENYLEYYKLTYQLLRTGGIMVFDNVLWGGEVTDLQNRDSQVVAIRALNDHVHHDDSVEASLLPIGDGVNIIRKL